MEAQYDDEILRDIAVTEYCYLVSYMIRHRIPDRQFIEVNSKPRKAPRTEKGRQDLVDLAFHRPMEYAIRLAQRKQPGPGREM